MNPSGIGGYAIEPTLTSLWSTASRGGTLVEVELVALDVLHHEARLVLAIGKQ